MSCVQAFVRGLPVTNSARHGLNPNRCKLQVTQQTLCKPGRKPAPFQMTKSDQTTSQPPELNSSTQASDTWELDFYSRPVLGLDGKKLWELIIVDSTQTFCHIEAIPNAQVNSKELSRRIGSVISQASRKPRQIRFFRVQMYNMIQIALSSLSVQAVPSRRTYALYQCLRRRERAVYPEMAGFQPRLAREMRGGDGGFGASLELVVTQRLPDALRCERFAFGTFPLGELQGMFEVGGGGEGFFGDCCLVPEEVGEEVMVPGLVVFSKRAYPLAAWISGAELAFISVVKAEGQIVLECGLKTRYSFAKISDGIRDDVELFEQRKKQVAGLHFLAVQKDAQSDEIEGLWLMCES